LCSGQPYYGHPDDQDDFYRIWSQVGTLQVAVTNYTADGAQLVVYGEDHRSIARDSGPGPDLYVTTPITESGKYYIRVYGIGGFTTTTWYTLIATFPEP
jgi:hypothetical protein